MSRDLQPMPRESRAAYVAVTWVLTLLLLANMTLIFLLSAEGREDSGDRSGRITQWVIDRLYPDFDAYPEEERETIRENVHHAVRKIAHFSEFGLLGVLSTAWLFHVDSRRSALKRWVKVGICAVFCLLYAVSDEVHQIFSGRGPAVTDVLIDTWGALTGIGALLLILWLTRWRPQKRGIDS